MKHDKKSLNCVVHKIKAPSAIKFNHIFQAERGLCVDGLLRLLQSPIWLTDLDSKTILFRSNIIIPFKLPCFAI